MDDGNVREYPSYPVFKGLQQPLEFMGLRGRYIAWAAATAGTALILFIIVYVVSGFLPALVVLGVTLTIGACAILVKQRKGLHGKRTGRGVYIFTRTCHD